MTTLPAGVEQIRRTAGCEPGALERVALAGVDGLLAECDSPFGRLRHVVLAARLSETRASWSRPPVPAGTHEAVWLA